MALFKPFYVEKSKLDQVPFIPGQLIFVTDAGRIFLDREDGRVEVSNKYTLPVANQVTLGGILSGSALSVADDGTVTIPSTGHTHTVSQLTDITAKAGEINFLSGATRSIQTQLNEKVPKTIKVNGHQLTSDVNITASEIGAVPTSRLINNFALGADVNLTASDVGAISKQTKGAVNGVAELDETGKVPVSQLPSYVDDVVEGYLNPSKTGFYYDQEYNNQIEATNGVIYVDYATEKTYRWSGSMFVEISPSVVLGSTSSTAFAGNKGTTLWNRYGDGAMAGSANTPIYINDGIPTPLSEAIPVSCGGTGGYTQETARRGLGIGNTGSYDAFNITQTVAEGFDVNRLPIITPAGMMNIGRYLNFHYDDGFKDYTSRIEIEESGNFKFSNSIEASKFIGTADKADKLSSGRQLKIGNTAQTFDGTKSLTWTLSDIGAAPSTVATGAANGLMSYQDKLKLDSLTLGGGAYIHPTYIPVTMGLHKLAVDGNGHVYEVEDVTKSDIVSLGIPGENTDTHYTSKNVVGSTTATTDTENIIANGNVYLNSVENGEVTSSHKISGRGATTVTTDTSGNIYVNSTDTTYERATQTSDGLMSYADKVKLNEISAGANNYTHPDGPGYNHIPAGGAANQILKWRDDGYAVWADDESIVYTLATQTSNGLLSASDKKKLDGISENANKYTHPTYSAKDTALYKVGIDNTGHVAEVGIVTKDDIVALGIPAQDTNTHYDSKNIITNSRTSLNPTSVTTNGNLYLNSVENGSVTSSHKISGSGGISVTSDVSGDINIDGSAVNFDEVTHDSHGLMSAEDKIKLDTISPNANNYQHPIYTTKPSNLYKFSVDNYGHVSTTSQISKEDIVNLGIPAQDTTYPEATNTSAGLMSASDKARFGSIATGATQNYPSETLPKANGTAYTGIEDEYARGDHVHPLQVNVSGNAGTADKLSTPRTISLNGAVTGSTTFDGSGDKTISTTLQNFDASKITTGTIDLARLPAAALERCVVVPDDATKYTLTSDDVQLGDTVKVTTTGKMYMVVNEALLSSSGGYVEFSSGHSATSQSALSANQLSTARNFKIQDYDGINSGDPVQFNGTDDVTLKLPNTIKATLDGQASYAVNDTLGQQIDSTYIKNLTASGRTLTFTRGDGTTNSFVTQDTHYSSNNVVGSSTATSNTSVALTDGNVYLNSVENGIVTSSHKISGSGAATVTSDASGNIIVTSTDTVYPPATEDNNGLMTSDDKKKLNTIEEQANNYVHPKFSSCETNLYKFSTTDEGHISEIKEVSKDDITGLGIPAQDTTYNPATISSDGLMLASDKTKLDGIDVGATRVLPSTVLPLQAGSPTIGSDLGYARGDHIHPKQINISGNAGTATKFFASKQINGTAFDGSYDITTNKWGTSRKLVIGNGSKDVDGSGDVTWTLAEINAVNKSGDTVPGLLTLNGGIKLNSTASGYLNGLNSENIPITSNQQTESYHPILKIKANSGNVFNFGGKNNEVGFYGYLKSRTLEGVDFKFTMDTTTGVWSSNKTITAPNFEGIASVATKLGEENVGSSTTPIYLSEGTPMPISEPIPISLGGTGATSVNNARTLFGLSGFLISKSISEGFDKQRIAEVTESGILHIGNTINFHYDGALSDYTSQLSIDSSGNLTLTPGKTLTATSFDGIATSAGKLLTDAGSTDTPIYFKDGVPVDLTGTIKNNAASASKLLNKVTINDTSFDGTESITTTKWGTGRNIQIGKTSKVVDGSTGVSWNLGEIGAISRTGDSEIGMLEFNKYAGINLQTVGGMVIEGSTTDNAPILISTTQTDNYHPILKSKSKSGHVFNIGGKGDEVGFYTYLNNRTAEGCSNSFTCSLSSGIWTSTALISAPSFGGDLIGNADTATKLQDSTQVGSGINPIYFNNGVPVASSSSIGDHDKPIHMENGEIKVSNASVGAATNPMYMENGQFKETTETIGTTTNPIYMNNGTLTASNATIGSDSTPIYLKNGVFTVADNLDSDEVITTNFFEFSFNSSISNITLNSGTWNETLGRLEV